jgi:cell division protein FtsZ
MARVEGAPTQATRSAAEARPEMRSRAPQPAVVAERSAQSYARSADEEDIKRRLSEAIGHGHETSGRQTPPAIPSSNGAGQRELHRETWRAPGNVIIEEGFSQMAWPQPAARSHDQEGDATPSRTDQFTPAPPADIRRSARRIPDVDDFPPVAQREYRAKVGHAAHASPSSAPRVVSGRDTSEEAPRRGLLQRLMSRARRSQEPEAPSRYDDHRETDPHADAQSWWQQDHDSNPDGSNAEQAPLPMVFNRHRK